MSAALRKQLSVAEAEVRRLTQLEVGSKARDRAFVTEIEEGDRLREVVAQQERDIEALNAVVNSMDHFAEVAHRLEAKINNRWAPTVAHQKAIIDKVTELAEHADTGPDSTDDLLFQLRAALVPDPNSPEPDGYMVATTYPADTLDRVTVLAGRWIAAGFMRSMTGTTTAALGRELLAVLSSTEHPPLAPQDDDTELWANQPWAVEAVEQAEAAAAAEFDNESYEGLDYIEFAFLVGRSALAAGLRVAVPGIRDTERVAIHDAIKSEHGVRYDLAEKHIAPHRPVPAARQGSPDV